MTHPVTARRRIRWIILIVLCLLPAIIALTYIHCYGVNGVFWDEFLVVPLFDKYHESTLTFHDFYKQHNEHRLLFPRLVLLPLGLATRFNTVVEMYVGWAFLCLSGLAIFLYLQRTYPKRQTACIAFLPAVWMLFNLRQSENLLWGLQMLFFMSTALFLLAVYCLSRARGPDRWFFAAAVLGFVATFSFSSMLLIWPIGLTLILVQPKFQDESAERRRHRALQIWSILGIFVWLFHFIGYTKPGKHPDFLYGMMHPLELLHYVGLYLGNPLGRSLTFRTVPGLLLLAAYLGCLGTAWRRWRAGKAIPMLPTAMMLFTLGSVTATSLSRVGFGAGQALSPRYVTFSSLGLIGLYLYVLALRPGLRMRIGKQNVAPLLGAVALLFIVQPMYKTDEGRQTYAHRSRMAYYLRTFELQNDYTLSQMSKQVGGTRRCAEILKRYKLNVFATETLRVSSLKRDDEMKAQHAIDTINGKLVAQSPGRILIPTETDTITIIGWARDGRANRPAGAVFADIDGTMEVPGLYGLPRPDVARHFKSRFKKVGFEITFSKALLTPGRHSLRLKIVSADKTRYAITETPIILELR